MGKKIHISGIKLKAISFISLIISIIWGQDMEEGVLWSRNFIPMDPDEIPLGPEAARISLRFPKANFGRIGLDAGDPSELPWPLWGQSGS